jgi:hypothetical protein|tara:strand:+ start:1509 stop:1754 length:246 start_codon:yes stop_codon:yes gene_type:complete
MTAIQEINFYNNFDLLSQTLKDHDPQVVQALNEIAVYVAGLHIENRDNLTFISNLKQECREKDIKIGMLSFKCEEYEEINA